MTLALLFDTLRTRFGSRSDPDIWWPVFHARTEPAVFERVITNLLVTQSDWRKVRDAVGALDREGLLTAKTLADADPSVIAACAKPVGFQATKAGWLKGLGAFVVRQFGTEAAFCAGVTRDQLLGLSGIGGETADRILLYTCGRMAWPVDTYCTRVLAHHGVIPAPPEKPTAGEKRELAAAVKATVLAEMPARLEDWQRLHALMQLEGEDMRLRAKATVATPRRAAGARP
jgi:endonuclease III related protein